MDRSYASGRYATQHGSRRSFVLFTSGTTGNKKLTAHQIGGAAGVHCEQREEQLKHDVDVTVGHVMEFVAVHAARLRDGGSSCFVLCWCICAR